MKRFWKTFIALTFSITVAASCTPSLESLIEDYKEVTAEYATAKLNGDEKKCAKLEKELKKLNEQIQKATEAEAKKVKKELKKTAREVQNEVEDAAEDISDAIKNLSK